MEQDDGNNIIKTDNNDVKENKNRSKNKLITTIFCIIAIATISGLAYLAININNQKNKIESEAKASKERLEKANEVIAKYELATGTKAVDADKDNTKVKEIVKPMAIDTKISDLISTLNRNFIKSTGENDEGQKIKDSWPITTFKSIFTNQDATYLFAEFEMGYMREVITDPARGVTRVESGNGGWHASYYRALPDGEWEKAYEGNGFTDCKEVSDEAKKVYKGVKDPNGKSILYCLDKNKKDNNGIVDF